MEFIDNIIGGYDNVGKTRPDNIEIQTNDSIYYKTIGGNCEFSIRDALISLKYIDLKQLNTDRREFVLQRIASVFRIKKEEEREIIEEITYLSHISDQYLINIYIRKFELYFIFSDVVKPLFMNIKDFFQKQIEIICNSIGIDIYQYVSKWKIEDEKHKVNTSSILLYYMNKDKAFMEEMKSKAEVINLNIAIENPTTFKDTYSKLFNSLNNWSYVGFCPYEPTQRMKLLLTFPLYDIFDFMQYLTLPDEKYIERQKEKLKVFDKEMLNIDFPSPPYEISKEFINMKYEPPKIENDNDKHMIEMIKKLICRLNDNKDSLYAWEDYYNAFTKIYAKISKRMHEILPD